MELLSTKTVVEIKDKDIFEIEGKSYLEFALTYASSSVSKMPPSPDIVAGGIGVESSLALRSSSAISAT